MRGREPFALARLLRAAAPPWPKILALAAPLVAVALATPPRLAAQEWVDPPASYASSWGMIDYSQWDVADSLTGGWGGRRSELKEKYGVEIFGGYQMESAGNPIGGRAQGVTYTHDVSLAMSAQLDKLAHVPHSYFLVSISDRAGASLSSSYIGNAFAVQQLFAGQTFRLAQLALGTRLFDERLDLVAGRINASDDFATSALYCGSQNEALCGNPGPLTTNISLSDYPSSAWGARASYRPHDAVHLLAGAYNAFRRFAANGYHGVDFSIRHDSGVIAIAEVDLLPHELPRSPFHLPGQWKVGGYYDNEPLTDLRTGTTQRGTWGAYAGIEHTLAASAGTGLSAFAIAYYAPPDVNQFEWFVDWGLVYQGLVPGRPQDALGLFGAYGSFSPALPQTYEIVLELNYTWAALPWLAVQPDIQGVLNPGGGGIDDALVLALQITVPF